ncbi:unnamed protein product, partial [marine sediment metagenome]
MILVLVFSGVAFAAPDVNLVPNCRLFLKFNEESWGAVVDDSSYGTDGVVHGSLTPASGKIGNCVTFAGDADNYITVTEVSDSLSFGEDTDFAIAFWFKTAEVDETEFFLSKMVYQGDGYCARLRGDDNKASFTVHAYGGISNSTITSVPVNDDTWHYAIGNFDRDANMVFYLDGEPNGTTPSMISLVNIDNDEALYLGRRSYDTEPLALVGSIDCLMIFDKLLSADEITFLY